MMSPLVLLIPFGIKLDSGWLPGYIGRKDLRMFSFWIFVGNGCICGLNLFVLVFSRALFSSYFCFHGIPSPKVRVIIDFERRSF